jgi:hypothetical protein
MNITTTPVQFIQGKSSKNIPTTITPGNLYFFQDGAIVWDCAQGKRVTMGDLEKKATISMTKNYSAGSWINYTKLASFAPGTYLVQIALTTSDNEFLGMWNGILAWPGEDSASTQRTIPVTELSFTGVKLTSTSPTLSARIGYVDNKPTDYLSRL